MGKTQSIYMWDNVDKTIQIIESRNDLIYKKLIYMIPNIVPKTMKIVHSNILILSKIFFYEKNIWVCVWV